MSNTAMTNYVIPYQDIQKMAQTIATSNLFGFKKPDEAMALMLIAQAEGSHPAKAIQEFHIIQGKPALKADAMLSRFQASGGVVKWVKMENSEVIGEFSHPAGGNLRISWTIKRAQEAELTGKDNWKKYPRQMLRARVISEGVRSVYPACNQGFYTPEEVQDFNNIKDVSPRNTSKSEIIETEEIQTEPMDNRPDYSNISFQENLNKWLDLMVSGQKTADEIIFQIETKYKLSDDQKQEIKDKQPKE